MGERAVGNGVGSPCLNLGETNPGAEFFWGGWERQGCKSGDTWSGHGRAVMTGSSGGKRTERQPLCKQLPGSQALSSLVRAAAMPRLGCPTLLNACPTPVRSPCPLLMLRPRGPQEGMPCQPLPTNKKQHFPPRNREHQGTDLRFRARKRTF